MSLCMMYQLANSPIIDVSYKSLSRKYTNNSIWCDSGNGKICKIDRCTKVDSKYTVVYVDGVCEEVSYYDVSHRFYKSSLLDKLAIGEYWIDSKKVRMINSIDTDSHGNPLTINIKLEHFNDVSPVKVMEFLQYFKPHNLPKLKVGDIIVQVVRGEYFSIKELTREHIIIEDILGNASVIDYNDFHWNYSETNFSGVWVVGDEWVDISGDKDIIESYCENTDTITVRNALTNKTKRFSSLYMASTHSKQKSLKSISIGDIWYSVKDKVEINDLSYNVDSLVYVHYTCLTSTFSKVVIKPLSEFMKAYEYLDLNSITHINKKHERINGSDTYCRVAKTELINGELSKIYYNLHDSSDDTIKNEFCGLAPKQFLKLYKV